MANPEDEEDEDSPEGDEMNNLQSVAGQVNCNYKFRLHVQFVTAFHMLTKKE